MGISKEQCGEARDHPPLSPRKYFGLGLELPGVVEHLFNVSQNYELPPHLKSALTKVEVMKLSVSFHFTFKIVDYIKFSLLNVLPLRVLSPGCD